MKNQRRNNNSSGQNWYDKYRTNSKPKKQRPIKPSYEDKKTTETWSFSNRGYTIEIEQEIPGTHNYGNRFEKKMVIKLSHPNQEGLLEELYKKGYGQINNEQSKIKSMEYLNTYGRKLYDKNGIKRDTFFYQLEKGCIYGINRVKKPTYPNGVTGLCVENTHLPYQQFQPPQLNLEGHNPKFNDDLNSFVIFKEEDPYQYHSNFIEIEKRGSNLDIKMYSKNINNGESEPVICHLIADAASTITGNDLQKIQTELNQYFGEYPFIEMVLEELEVFKRHLTKEIPEQKKMQDYLDYDFESLEKSTETEKKDFLNQVIKDFETISQDYSRRLKSIARILKKDLREANSK